MEETKMLKAEIKKILSFKIMWIIFACMLCVNGYAKISNAYNRYYSPKEYTSYFAELNGKTTQEALNYSENKIENSSEHNNTYLYYDIAEICRELINYPDYINGISHTSDNMAVISIWGGEDTFSYRNIKRTPSAYKDLSPNILPLDTSLGVEDFLDSPITDMLVLVLLFICVCRIFLYDREQGILSLLYSTPNGRNKLILNKITVSVICSAFLAIAFFSEVFLIENILYGFGNLSRPIQSVFGYYTCNLAISVGEYMILYVIMKFLAYSVFAIIFSCICTLSQNNLTVYGASAGICGVFYILYSNISVLSPLSLLHYWNPVQILNLKEVLGTYTNVNFLGYPISLKKSTVIVAMFLIISMITLTCIVFSKARNLQYKCVSLSNKIHFKPKVHSIFFYTCKRVLILQKGIIILFIAIIVSFGFSETVKRSYTNDEIYYENFCTKYAGEVNEETRQFIYDKIKFYKEIENQIEILEKSGNSSRFKLNELYANLNDKVAFERFKNRIDRITEKAEIFYDTGYERYFGLDENNDNTVLILIIMISLVLILSPIPSQDNRTNMTKILFTTKAGKMKYFKNPVYFSAIISILISFIVSLPYLYQILNKYGHEGIGKSINGIAGFSDIPTFITIGLAILIVILIRTILSILCGVTITLISSKCKGATSAYCVNSVIFVLPVIVMLSEMIIA